MSSGSHYRKPPFFLLLFQPSKLASSLQFILLCYSEACAWIWAQFNHVPYEWVKRALKSFHSKGRKEMGAPGCIQALIAEQQPQSLAPASLVPALDHRATSPATCSSGCRYADWRGFATACLSLLLSMALSWVRRKEEDSWRASTPSSSNEMWRQLERAISKLKETV